jgi:DNA processing protein
MGMSGGSHLLKLLRELGPECIWRASARDFAAWGVRDGSVSTFEERRRLFDAVEAEEILKAKDLRFVPYGSKWYPRELTQLEFPPSGLFVRASEAALEVLAEAPRITVVGTRKATSEGLRTAEAFVSALSSRGVVVVSGMALGIDAKAHATALRMGGSTVAILGCGADIVYPRVHRWLYESISKNGVVASELPPGSCPTRWTFPHRNRLLAALGDAALVVEGSNTSGALQTAKWALDLGRPVFSVPGSIFREGSEGCNRLLYDGAFAALRPEATVEDFLHQTRIERGDRGLTVPANQGASAECPSLLPGSSPDSRCRRVLEALAPGAASVDHLVVVTGLPVREIGAALGELEVSGLVVRGGPGTYLRSP